jgi:hypothetical protein
MTHSETELRSLWNAAGVPEDRQNAMLAEIEAKAQPAAIAAMLPESFETRREPNAPMYIGEIRNKAGRVVFKGEPQDTQKRAAYVALRDGPKSAKHAMVSNAYRDPSGNWQSNGSNIQWFKREDVARDPQPPADVGLFDDVARAQLPLI